MPCNRAVTIAYGIPRQIADLLTVEQRMALLAAVAQSHGAVEEVGSWDRYNAPHLYTPGLYEVVAGTDGVAGHLRQNPQVGAATLFVGGDYGLCVAISADGRVHAETTFSERQTYGVDPEIAKAQAALAEDLAAEVRDALMAACAQLLAQQIAAGLGALPMAQGAATQRAVTVTENGQTYAATAIEIGLGL